MVKKDKVYILQHIPEDILDREICLEAVKEDSLSLEYAPKEYIDKRYVFRSS